MNTQGSSSTGPSSSPTAPTTLSFNSRDADPADLSRDSVAVEDLWSSDDGQGDDDDSRDYIPSPASANITRPYRLNNGSARNLNIEPGQGVSDVVGHQVYVPDHEGTLKFRTIVATAQPNDQSEPVRSEVAGEDEISTIPRLTYSRRLPALNALYVQTNQQVDETTWRSNLSPSEDQLLLGSIFVFSVIDPTADQLTTIRKQLETDPYEQHWEERSLVYIQVPLPASLRPTQKPDSAFQVGGWPPTLRTRMIRCMLDLYEQLPDSIPPAPAIFLDPDTPQDGLVTLLYLYDEEDLPLGLNKLSTGSAGGMDAYVREGVRVKLEDACVVVSSAGLNGTMDEAVEPDAQQLPPWTTPFPSEQVHHHLYYDYLQGQQP